MSDIVCTILVYESGKLFQYSQQLTAFHRVPLGRAPHVNWQSIIRCEYLIHVKLFSAKFLQSKYFNNL